MRIKASMFGIILISVQVLAQSNVELSEIETNPIPTMVNFDGYQRNVDQTQQEQGYFDFDGTFIHSNTEVIQNIENNKSIEDPNNFILENLNIQTLNSEITTVSNNENQIQGLNDIPQLDMIDTQILTQQDLNNICIIILYLLKNKLYFKQKQQFITKLNTLQYQCDLTLAETEKNAENSDCIIIYSQCHFKGDSLKLCESQRDIDNFDHDIKSVQIPKGYSVRLYNKEDFTGNKIILKESQECLTKPLSLTQLYEKQSHKFTILAQNLNLRGI